MALHCGDLHTFTKAGCFFVFCFFKKSMHMKFQPANSATKLANSTCKEINRVASFSPPSKTLGHFLDTFLMGAFKC